MLLKIVDFWSIKRFQWLMLCYFTFNGLLKMVTQKNPSWNWIFIHTVIHIKLTSFPTLLGPGRDFEIAGRGKRAGAEAETTIRTDVGHSHHRDLPSAQFCQRSAVLMHRIDHVMTIKQQTFTTTWRSVFGIAHVYSVPPAIISYYDVYLL